jgi:hypothetical protein
MLLLFAARTPVVGVGLLLRHTMLVSAPFSLEPRSAYMIGDYSSINDHLESARRLADSAETKADPAIYREAIDELVAAIRLLMRNSQESED